MSKTTPRDGAQHFKPASLSFRDERTRWEWGVAKEEETSRRRARRTPVVGDQEARDWKEIGLRKAGQLGGVCQTG
jgi:hypothetical protein